MRTLEQVDRDIELVRYDMHLLMKMRQPISVIAEDLLELYDERKEILKANKKVTLANQKGHRQVPIAEWIVQDDTFTRFECSRCHTKNHHTRWDYCPSCGAKMENAHG